MNYKVPKCYYNCLLIDIRNMLKKEENKNNEDLKSLANSIMCLVSSSNTLEDTKSFSNQVYEILDKQGFYDNTKEQIKQYDMRVGV